MSYLSPASGPLRIVISSRSSKFLENIGTPISISRKYRVKSNNKKIILYQSSIRTQLTLKENLNIQNQNHYLVQLH